MAKPLRPILIAGPTASGKSSLALDLAERLGGWVVNADSMQVYSGWHLLTARPSPDDEGRTPHRLYGHVDPSFRYSAGEWLRDITSILHEAREDGVVPIIVGGTGLNFTALTRGLSDIPAISPEVRDATTALHRDLGPDAMRQHLLARDPGVARLDIENPRRVQRAWEVLEQTGRSLTDWMDNTPPPLLPPENAHLFAVEADRASNPASTPWYRPA
jgi:tRNA dimethylallyltransferase